MAATIDVSAFKALLDQDQALALDVREPDEYAKGHVPGALLLPGGVALPGNLPELQGKRLVVYCQSGRRSAEVQETLKQEAPALDVVSLEHGISAWTEAGLPTTGQPSKMPLPMHRQVQVGVGVLLLFFSLMGATYGRGFYLGTGFLGAGLTFAGMTGFCGLALLLGKMPWNR